MNTINFSVKGKDFSLSLEDFFGHQLCITTDDIQAAFLGFEVRGSEAFIEMIEVDNEFRRMGLAKRLYQALIEFCKKNNINVISGSAVNKNIPAIRKKQLGNINTKDSNGSLKSITAQAASDYIKERKLLMLYSRVS